MALSASPAHAKAGVYVPAAPVVHYAQGGLAPDPGVDFAGTGAAAYAADTDTIHYEGLLGKSARGHENGHALDDQVLSDGDRRFFTRLMGLIGDWNQGTGMTGFHSPNEWFADWYGNAANGRDGFHQWDSAYAPAPNPKAYRKFRQALDRLGRRHHLKPYSP